ncbi:MAG TPA: pectate lyase [Pilimelia sp.]|nr:pectate lyase [Pilimelia sp.]
MTLPATEAPKRRSRRWRGGIAVAAVAAMATTGAVIGLQQASAATIDANATYVIVNRDSGKALDVFNWSTSNGGAIVQFARNNLAVQQWRIVATGSYYRLRSVHSNKTITLGSTADGAAVTQQNDSSSNNAQQFSITDTSSGYVKLVNRASGKALETWMWNRTDGGQISQFADSGGNNQQWQLVKLGTGSTPTTPGNGGGNPPPPPPPTGGGSVSTTFPSPAGQVRVTGTTNVSGSFDGGMKRYYGIGDGGQSESQDAMFELAAGATLRNVIIGAPAGDGVHCNGNCTLINVWWEDVGEDAATFLGGSSYSINGGGAKGASDKIFQHNGPGTLTISNFYAETGGKLYRACGNCSASHQRHVVMNNVTVRGVKVLAGINTNWGDTARFSRIRIIGSLSSTTICEKYNGVPKGSEPTKIGSGADGRNCIYSASDITAG